MQRGPERFIPGPCWIAGIAETVSFRIGERLSLSENKVRSDGGRQIGVTVCVRGEAFPTHGKTKEGQGVLGINAMSNGFVFLTKCRSGEERKGPRILQTKHALET